MTYRKSKRKFYRNRERVGKERWSERERNRHVEMTSDTNVKRE